MKKERHEVDMGIFQNIFKKPNKNGQDSSISWTYPEGLPEEEYPIYEACKTESIAYDESLHKYAAMPLNMDSYVYSFLGDKKGQTIFSKENLKKIKNDHDEFLERYHELRRISGIWDKEMPEGYDISKETRNESASYRLTLPGKKEYIFSSVLFDNSISNKDENSPEMNGWAVINKALNTRLGSGCDSGSIHYPYAWYQGPDADNISETTAYLRQLGVAEDICSLNDNFTYERSYKQIQLRLLIHGWIWNGVFKTEEYIDENGDKNIRQKYALDDTRGYDAYNTVYDAAKEKGPGAVEMFRDELKKLINRISFNYENLLTLFPVDVLSSDEVVYQLLYRKPYKGLNRQQATKMIYNLDCSVRAYTNLSDLAARLGVPLETMDEIPAVKIWLNDDRRCGEAFLECIEKGMFREEYFEDTKYCRVDTIIRKDFDRLVKWYRTRSREALPPAHHNGKGSFTITLPD